jgi:hypothetical protein
MAERRHDGAVGHVSEGRLTDVELALVTAHGAVEVQPLRLAAQVAEGDRRERLIGQSHSRNFLGTAPSPIAYLSRRHVMRLHEDRDTKNAMTDIAAVQRYNRTIEIAVAALAFILVVGLLAYASVGA